MSAFREREASQNIVVDVPERQAVPRETARFPFRVRGGERSYSIHEFSVSSDNPNFDPRWARIVKETDGRRSPRYIAEIRPANINRRQYGAYPISIRCDAPDVSQPAVGQCTLIIKPCIRLIGKPTFRTWPGGVLSMSLDNCGGAGIDISVSVNHHGSSWSKGWEFELEADEGPFKFKETFEPPADGAGGGFELQVSAEGISLFQMPIRARNFAPAPKQAVAAAVVLVGAAVGITLAEVLPGPALTAQSISFTSEPSSTAVGATYVVTARGGGSGNPVTFSSGSPDVCSVDSPTVTFGKPGECVIEANQDGSDKYSPAPPARQKIVVTGGSTKMTQAIVFTSKPSSTFVDTLYTVTARGGGSGNPVTFSSGSPDVCLVDGPAVTFGAPGDCVINANQAGNDQYLPAPQAQQVIAVKPVRQSQTISFTSTPPNPAYVGSNPYNVTATATSGGPVSFSSGSPNVCSVSGSTVTFENSGTCVVDASQPGDEHYLPAPPAQQDISVDTQPPSPPN